MLLILKKKKKKKESVQFFLKRLELYTYFLRKQTNVELHPFLEFTP